MPAVISLSLFSFDLLRYCYRFVTRQVISLPKRFFLISVSASGQASNGLLLSRGWKVSHVCPLSSLDVHLRPAGHVRPEVRGAQRRGRRHVLGATGDHLHQGRQRRVSATLWASPAVSSLIPAFALRAGESCVFFSQFKCSLTARFQNGYIIYNRFFCSVHAYILLLRIIVGNMGIHTCTSIPHTVFHSERCDMQT